MARDEQESSEATVAALSLYGASARPGDGRDTGRNRRRGRLVAGLAAVALILAGTAISACSPANGRSDEERGWLHDGRWAEGITPAWMSAHMGFEIPATARDAKAAYQVTSRVDTGLLTFTLTRAEAEAYLKKHPTSGKWLTPEPGDVGSPERDFTHLGVPQPESLKQDLRYGGLCPSGPKDLTDPYDTSDERCSRLFAHEYAPDRTRIYLRTTFDPGIRPLPKG
ncbi:hypothetical protein ABZ990_06385 [Streptomyces sp. NPDC046203]|uniref:hypothetical protein n=1 Tax=Streptomyces sp. NPDC046203 TaxID=3154602 RepID=UPI0033ECF2F1